MRKKVLGGLMILILMAASGCMASDKIGNGADEKTAEFSGTFSEEDLQNLQATIEGAEGISVEELAVTQQAFTDLSPEDIQATVNSATGMDEETVRADYYIPDAAIYITQLGEMVNFQIMWPMADVIDYYRAKLEKEGLSEKESNTSITEITGNLVFSGHENGKLLVVQTVALSDAQTNVSIRFEVE